MIEERVLTLIELAREFTENKKLDFDSYIDGLFSSLDIEDDVIMNMLIKYHTLWIRE